MVYQIKNSNIKIIIFGNGFSGSVISEMALKYSSNIFLISRLINNIKNEKIKLLNFNDFDVVSKELNNSIIISTAPPDEQGNDPIL